jgi:3-hydroxy-9,10-secoandrosta-1,3,5(10)-triene-9,17-dione monooxygenase reductase component
MRQGSPAPANRRAADRAGRGYPRSVGVLADDVRGVAAGRFREVMGHFATGISVVTTFEPEPDGGLGGADGPGTADGAGGPTRASGKPAGITVNAFSSVSLEPALVMVALDRRRFITPMVRAAGRYAVNVLGADQQALSDCFAHAPVSPGRELFCGASWQLGPTGLPLIDGSIATLECTVVETFSAGDHDLFIGRVDSLEQHRPEVEPLLYYRRRYLRVEQSADSPVEGKPEG